MPQLPQRPAEVSPLLRAHAVPAAGMFRLRHRSPGTGRLAHRARRLRRLPNGAIPRVDAVHGRLQEEAQQFPHLVPDLLQADFPAHGLVVVLGAHAARALHDLKAVAEHGPHHRGLLPQGLGPGLPEEVLHHAGADAGRPRFALPVRVHPEICRLEDRPGAPALVAVRVADPVARLGMIGAVGQGVPRIELAVQPPGRLRLHQLRSDVLSHSHILLLFRPGVPRSRAHFFLLCAPGADHPAGS